MDALTTKPQCWKNCRFSVPVNKNYCCISSEISKMNIYPKIDTKDWGEVSVVNDLGKCKQCGDYMPKENYQIKGFNNFDREDFLHDDDR